VRDVHRPAHRLLAAALVAAGCAVGVGGAAPAAAATGEERIVSFDVRLAVQADGGLHVTEVIDYDFGFAERHGIFRVIPSVTRYDDTYDRAFPIDNVRVHSADAPDQTEVGSSDGQVSIRVGDPDRTITGDHTYTIDYDVSGALQHFARPFDHVELNWNATGDQWEVPIERARVLVTGPAEVASETCYAGAAGSRLPCERHHAQGRRATFAQTDLPPGEGLTVVVAFPTGSVTATGPILHERLSIRRAFAATPLSLTLAGLVLLAVLAGIGRVYWSRGRDRRYVGQIPGLEPAAGQQGPDEPAPLLGASPAVLEYTPPDGIRPGQIGTLLDERADTLDVTATLVDLAVRKYLRIDELPHEHWWNHKDWQLTRLDPPTDDQLAPYESRLLDGLFDKGAVVKLSDLHNSFYSSLQAVKNKLYDDAVAAKWFRHNPEDVRRQWQYIGWGVVVVGVGLTYLLYRYTHLAHVGLPVVLGGVVLLAMRGSMPARTAKGGAMLSRVRGFRRYLETAEAEQLRFEERADVFARYLPYAIVFGLTDRWAKVFAALADADPQLTTSTMGWYGGPPGWNAGYLAGSMSSFTTSASGTFASQPSSSGSSSGFSGGFSGGGGGGGGGGSW
jgi:uncharacterized membrane protein YgcG